MHAPCDSQFDICGAGGTSSKIKVQIDSCRDDRDEERKENEFFGPCGRAKTNQPMADLKMDSEVSMPGRPY